MQLQKLDKQFVLGGKYWQSKALKKENQKNKNKKNMKISNR